MGILDVLRHRGQVIEKERQEKQEFEQWERDFRNDRENKFIISSVNAIESYVLQAIHEKRFSGLLRNIIAVPTSVTDPKEYYFFCSKNLKKYHYGRIIANQVEAKHPDWHLKFGTDIKDRGRYGDGWFVHIDFS